MRVDEAGLEWVKVKHPVTGGETEVSRESFDSLWESKGWVLNEDATPSPAAVVAEEPVVLVDGEPTPGNPAPETTQKERNR